MSMSENNVEKAIELIVDCSLEGDEGLTNEQKLAISKEVERVDFQVRFHPSNVNGEEEDIIHSKNTITEDGIQELFPNASGALVIERKSINYNENGIFDLTPYKNKTITVICKDMLPYYINALGTRIAPLLSVLDVIKLLKAEFRPTFDLPGVTHPIGFIGREKQIEDILDLVLSNCSNRSNNAKAEWSIPVCCGAAGVGKTSFFTHVINEIKRVWQEKGPDKYRDYHVISMYTDFFNGPTIRKDETNPGIILGLRFLAQYAAPTEVFTTILSRIEEYFRERLLPFDESLFHIGEVIESIEKFEKGKKLIILWHWDGIQHIRLSGSGSSKPFLRELFDQIKGYFLKGSIPVQLFLSGTFVQEELMKEPSGYTFHHFELPFFTLKQIFESFDQLAEFYGCEKQSWRENKHLVHELASVGGLPRAFAVNINRLLEYTQESARNFFKLVGSGVWGVTQANECLTHVSNYLRDQYQISTWIMNNIEHARFLFHASLREWPIPIASLTGTVWKEAEIKSVIFKFRMNNNYVNIKLPIIFLQLYYDEFKKYPELPPFSPQLGGVLLSLQGPFNECDFEKFHAEYLACTF